MKANWLRSLTAAGRREKAALAHAHARSSELAALSDDELLAAAQLTTAPATSSSSAARDDATQSSTSRASISGAAGRTAPLSTADAAHRTPPSSTADATPSPSPRSSLTADELLPIVAEAAARTVGLRPFACQLSGARHLAQADVIQMATGEGKTLVGAMAAVIYALHGNRVHCMTVNAYLAQRDAEWMGPLFEFFGLRAGAIGETMPAEQRREIYQRDIVFAAVTDLGFDVLRDHLITRCADQVQAPAQVAIIDEADSVMVDQALVPLVLAGSAPGLAPTGRINDIVSHLELDRDYTVDADRRNVFLTDDGAHRVEQSLGIPSLYDAEHISTTLVQVNVALHAHELLVRDVHYIVRDGKVQLIDNSKGRVADLQRWPDGLQAAVEAKEGLDVTDGGRILDSITVQALVGRYSTVCGMTGTATAAKDQLRQFYGRSIAVIEPNVPSIRFDEADRIFDTHEHRLAAVVDYIAQMQRDGRPVLVGTHSVAESEELHAALAEHGIDCVVLNAKNDEREAAIIAHAGEPGRVTVSTQMAGRGTDIRLGGPDEATRDSVVAAGGLVVVGYGRHRSARLDDQLRGRAGRQGDPGSTVFFVSLEDDVVAVGGAGETLRVVPGPGGEIDNRKASQFVDHCQRVTEGQLLDIHATTWKYSKLINDQRAIIDERRREFLDTDRALVDLQAAHVRSADDVPHVTDQGTEQTAEHSAGHAVECAADRAAKQAAEHSIDHTSGRAVEYAAEHSKNDPASVLEQAARDVALYYLDERWADHLAYLNDVRESIHLRALARESPLDEFHRMAVAAFGVLAEGALADARAMWETVEFTPSGADLGREGLERPSSTWTYMVNDNPLSGNGGSVVGSIVGMFR